MPPHRPLLRSPLLTVLGAGVLLVACSSDDTGGTSSPYSHSAGSTTGATSPSAGSSSAAGNGAGATATPASGSSSGGSSAAPTTGTGSTSTGSGSGGSTGASPTPSDDAGSTTTAPAAPAYTVAVDDATPSIDLADTKVLTITVTPQSWAGAVTLSATGLPSDVTGAFDNATLNLSGTTAMTAKLTLTSIDASVPVATPFQIAAAAGSTVKNAAATLTVNSVMTIVLPANADSIATSLGPTVNITAPANIATNPVTINFLNDDSTPHEIHAENPKQGFPHGAGTFAQGKSDTPRLVTVAGTYPWHLHDDPAPTAGGKGPNAASIIIK
jgi:hypothetical protein